MQQGIAPKISGCTASRDFRSPCRKCAGSVICAVPTSAYEKKNYGINKNLRLHTQWQKCGPGHAPINTRASLKNWKPTCRPGDKIFKWLKFKNHTSGGWTLDSILSVIFLFDQLFRTWLATLQSHHCEWGALSTLRIV